MPIKKGSLLAQGLNIVAAHVRLGHDAQVRVLIHEPVHIHSQRVVEAWPDIGPHCLQRCSGSIRHGFGGHDGLKSRPPVCGKEAIEDPDICLALARAQLLEFFHADNRVVVPAPLLGARNGIRNPLYVDRVFRSGKDKRLAHLGDLFDIAGQDVDCGAALGSTYRGLHPGSGIDQKVGTGAGAGGIEEPICRPALRLTQVISVHVGGLADRGDIDKVALRLPAAGFRAKAFDRFPDRRRHAAGENPANVAEAIAGIEAHQVERQLPWLRIADAYPLRLGEVSHLQELAQNLYQLGGGFDGPLACHVAFGKA